MRHIIVSCLLLALVGCDTGSDDWIDPVEPKITVTVQGEVIDSYSPYQPLKLRFEQRYEQCIPECLYPVEIVDARYQRVDARDWQPDTLNVGIYFDFARALLDDRELTLADFEYQFQNMYLYLIFPHEYETDSDGVVIEERITGFDTDYLTELGVYTTQDNITDLRIDFLDYDDEHLSGIVTGIVTTQLQSVVAWDEYPADCPKIIFYHTIPDEEDECQGGSSVMTTTEQDVYLPFSIDFTLLVELPAEPLLD